MKSVKDLLRDINDFLSGVEYGDQYIGGDPELEDGLELDLYQYLKEKGHLVVYELTLPDLKQYLDEEMNLFEGIKGFSYPKDSLRPDLVVNLGQEGYACLELKYNETSKKEIAEDVAKCRVYIKQCLGVSLAGYIHLHKREIVDQLCEPYTCEDDDYVYNFGVYKDNPITNAKKTITAYPIHDLWAERAQEIADGGGKFADYE